MLASSVVRFVDRYYTMLTPRVADAIAQQVRPAAGEPAALGLVPPGVAEVTLVRVARPGETFDALLTALSSHVDASVSATILK